MMIPQPLSTTGNIKLSVSVHFKTWKQNKAKKQEPHKPEVQQPKIKMEWALLDQMQVIATSLQLEHDR